MAGKDSGAISLDLLKQRFTQAESMLANAARSVEQLEGAAQAFNGARAGLGEAVQAIGDVRSAVLELAASLRENARQLAEATGTLKETEPALVLRQLTALEGAFHAGQTRFAERTNVLESVVSAELGKLGDRLSQGTERVLEASSKAEATADRFGKAEEDHFQQLSEAVQVLRQLVDACSRKLEEAAAESCAQIQGLDKRIKSVTILVGLAFLTTVGVLAVLLTRG